MFLRVAEAKGHVSPHDDAWGVYVVFVSGGD